MDIFLLEGIKKKDFRMYITIILGIIGIILITKVISMKYLFLLLIILFFCSIVIYKPLWGLYIFAFLMPLEEAFYFEGEGLAGTMLKPLGIIIFTGWLIQQFLRKKNIYFPKVLKFALLYAIWAMLSLSWSYQPLISNVFSLLTLVGLFFTVPQIITNLKDLNKIIVFSVAGSLISVSFVIFSFLQNPTLRATIFGKNPGHYPISISWAIFFFFIYAIYGSKVEKIVSIPIFITTLLAAFSTQTRSCLLAFSFAILFFLWYLIKYEKQKIFTKLCIFIIILFLSFFFISQYLPQIFYDRIENVIINRTMSTPRFEAWYVAWLAFLRHPLTGVGFNNLYLMYPNIYVSKWEIGSTGFCAHNAYFESLAGLGIFGFILITLVVFLILNGFLKTFLYFSKSISSSNKLLGLIIVLYLIALIVTSFWQPLLLRKYFWFGLAISLTYTKLLKDNKRL